jgi:cellulose synthase/poly-beta-1,6-N-acetylglucosamine synthase-like glycosyltransferase
MMTVIIPAQNEREYLNRTIQNLYDTCAVPPEVIVVDNGGNGEIDKRAKVLKVDANVGERKAMNLAARAATKSFLLRIDAHCDFSPHGWDVMMCNATGEKDLTVSVLTATDKNWNRLPGHWYGFCHFIVNEHGGLECKWQKPNRDHSQYQPIEPNMGATGCGMMLRKSFYEQIGGADEDLPPMGAIGEEFAIKAWYHWGKCQTRTDTMIGHIFGTGGYDTSRVIEAQQKLMERYGSCLESVREQFPDWNVVKLVTAKQPGKGLRTVTVDRRDVTDSKDQQTGQLLRRKIETYRYVWIVSEHPDESDWTDEQIEKKYAPLAVKVGERIEYQNVE